MNSDVLIGLLAGLSIGFLVYNFLKKGQKTSSEDLSSVFDKKIPLIASTVKQQLDAEKQDIKTDLKNKKEAFEEMMKRILDELKQTYKRNEQLEKETVSSFKAVRQAIDSHQKITEQLSVTADGLKRVLSNNQLRGQFSEQVAEDLLKMAGFVKGVDYEKNKEQHSGNRPDFTVLLPNGTKINIDAKFPFSNLIKSTESDNPITKKEYMKAFEQDVKEKIKQCSSRDYINPEENTVDFVILFIPNEMIFSYIYDQLNTVWLEGMKQKVILAGPFSFTAILRLVRQSYDTFRYQKNLQKIIDQIKTFGGEFQKYNQEFEKIGERIMSLSQQYDKVNTTRTKQLMRSVDKILLEEAQTPLLDADIENLGKE